MSQIGLILKCSQNLYIYLHITTSTPSIAVGQTLVRPAAISAETPHTPARLAWPNVHVFQWGEGSKPPLDEEDLELFSMPNHYFPHNISLGESHKIR